MPVVFLGQWTAPFGHDTPHHKHVLANPHSTIYVPEGVQVAKLKGGFKWSDMPEEFEREQYPDVLRELEEKEKKSKAVCEADHALLRKECHFVPGHQGERNLQMCSQELVGTSTGYCRVQSLLLELQENFRADEKWWADLFYRSLHSAGVSSPLEDVAKAVRILRAEEEPTEMELVENVVQGVVRGFTVHATSFLYRYDKIPMGKGQVLEVDMWQRRLMEGCGDCEDFALLMLSMRNRFLHEEFTTLGEGGENRTRFLRGVRTLVAGMDFYACCVRAAAPKLDPEECKTVGREGVGFSVPPSTQVEALKVHDIMQTFHVACFFAGDAVSPVGGMPVDDAETAARNRALKPHGARIRRRLAK